MTKLLSICGSPTENSSTEILLRTIADSICKQPGKTKIRHDLIRLNDRDFIPCQACGEAPTPKFCFFDDDLTTVYRKLAEADCVLFGSPIFFDTVAAQAKAFIDRCNCVRPPDYDNANPDRDFTRLLVRKRPGAIILVGGEQAWFEGARRCIAGWFKWVEIVNEGVLTFSSPDFHRIGQVVECANTMEEARKLGVHLARELKTTYA